MKSQLELETSKQMYHGQKVESKTTVTMVGVISY